MNKIGKIWNYAVTKLIAFKTSNRVSIVKLNIRGKNIRWSGSGFITIDRSASAGYDLFFAINGKLEVHGAVQLGDYFRAEDTVGDNSIIIERGTEIGIFSKIKLLGNGTRLRIAANNHFRGDLNIVADKGGELDIKANSFFNNGCSFNCQQKITIGEHCMFGEQVKLYDHNHIYGHQHEGFITNEFTAAPISVGKNCWIGSNVIILKGVTIGDHVVIGANCLVYKSIPSNSIVRAGSELKIEPIK